MYKEEEKLLRLLEDVAYQGLCSATLPAYAGLYNDLAAAMVNCGRKLLKRQAASAGMPVDHFADEAALDLLKYLDRVLTLPSKDRLPYIRACVKNVFRRYISSNAYKNQLPQEIMVAAPENAEQTVLRKEAVALFLGEAASELSLREFYAFFYVRLVGISPGELEGLLQSYGQAAMTQALIGQLCSIYCVPPGVFTPIINKGAGKGGISSRSITQAIQRASSKMRALATLLL